MLRKVLRRGWCANKSGAHLISTLDILAKSTPKNSRVHSFTSSPEPPGLSKMQKPAYRARSELNQTDHSCSKTVLSLENKKQKISLDLITFLIFLLKCNCMHKIVHISLRLTDMSEHTYDQGTGHYQYSENVFSITILFSPLLLRPKFWICIHFHHLIYFSLSNPSSVSFPHPSR